MTDQNTSRPPAGGAWNAPVQTNPAGQAPPPPQGWTPPNAPPPSAPPPPPGAPPASFNPTPVGWSGSRAGYRRGGIRGNGIYSMVLGIISLLVPLVTLLVSGGGRFTYLIFLPVLGLIYGIVSVVQGNRRGFGIAGIVLCGLGILLELVSLVG